MTVPVNFAFGDGNSRGLATMPTAAASFQIDWITQNGAATVSGVGQVNFAPGSAFASFTGSAELLAAEVGDVFILNAPTTQDATLADIGITLYVERA